MIKLLEYKPTGVPIFISEFKQQYGAENKIYFLSAATPNKLGFCPGRFLEVPCDLEKMAKVINYYVSKYGYSFNTKELKGSRPLLYNKMKRFFLPGLIDWDTPVVTKKITSKEEFRRVLKKRLPLISREQKNHQAAEALVAFLES